MAYNVESPAALGDRASNLLCFGGCEHPEATEPQALTQDEARRCEGIARRYALAALGLAGGLALQHVALSRFYAGRAASLIAGGAQ